MTKDATQSLQQLMEAFMHRSMRNFIMYLKQRELSMSHIGALFILHRRGMCGVSDIGEELGITTAATSQMLNRLVEEGLIERSEDPSDRRSKRILLTEKGTAALKESIHARQNWLHRLAETLDDQEHQLVMQALGLLLEKAALLDEQAPGEYHPA